MSKTNEEDINHVSFISSLALFWLKSHYSLTYEKITGCTPVFLFGIIPMGKDEFSQPLNTISSITASTNFKILYFLFGMFFLILGFFLSNYGYSFWVILLLIIGALNLLNSYTTTFLLSNNLGKKIIHEISILEIDEVQEFTNAIISLTGKTNNPNKSQLNLTIMNQDIKSNEQSTSGQTIIINQTENKSNGVGTAGFVLALIGLFVGWIPVLGWIVWFLGLVLSFIGIFKTPRGMAIAGLIISLIGVILLLTAAAGLAALFAI